MVCGAPPGTISSCDSFGGKRHRRDPDFGDRLRASERGDAAHDYPGAIAHVLVRMDDQHADEHSVARVAAWLQKRRGALDETAWERDDDAARTLKDCVADLTDARVEYDKVRHGVAMTNWLLANAPEALREIADMLDELLREVPTT